MDFIDKILLESDILDKKIMNPATGKAIKISSALAYDNSEPVKRLALAMLKRVASSSGGKIVIKPQEGKPIPKPIPTVTKELPKEKPKVERKPREPKPEKIKKIKEPRATKDAKPNSRSHKPKSNSYGISKECVEFLKSKGLVGLNVYPQTFVTPDQIQINPLIEKEGKDSVWVAKFPVKLPNGKDAYKTAYTREFMKKSQKQKYKKISKIKESDITDLDTKTSKLLQSKEKVVSDAACIIKIILKTGLRIGSSDSDTEGGTGNLGVRTLKKENIQINGDTVELKFIGKSYQENIASIKDKEIADYLSRTTSKLNDKNDIFSCTYNQVGQIMDKINPKKINPKDLRTYKATALAKQLLQSEKLGPPPPLPENPKEIKKTVKDKLKAVFEKVAVLLNNTPNMARNSYVHPIVITDFLDNLGLKPEDVRYKHITLEVKKMLNNPNKISLKEETSHNHKFTSMDQMFAKYPASEEIQDADLNEEDNLEKGNKISDDDMYNCEEYPIPHWFFDDNIDLVKKSL